MSLQRTSETRWAVPIDSDETSVAYFSAEAGEPAALFICGPSAGGDLAEAGLLRVVRVLQRIGLDVVTFNFLYRQRGQRRPDPMPLLQRTFAAIVAFALQRMSRPPLILIGGRSMGGRVASMLAADGFECDGLVLFAYPLHPAGEPSRLRSAHLPRIAVPTLCFNGTRDRLCTRELMEATVNPLAPRWTMHWLEAADHGFHVPKASGRSDDDILEEIGQAASGWLKGLTRRS
jgi:predicted alpha/beta-hydrolase family hydrolase